MHTLCTCLRHMPYLSDLWLQCNKNVYLLLLSYCLTTSNYGITANRFWSGFSWLIDICMQTQSGTGIVHILLLFQLSIVDTGFLVTPRPPFYGFGWFPFVADPLEFFVFPPSLFSCWWYFHELLRNLLYIHVSDEQILPFVWLPFVQGGLLSCFPNAELKILWNYFWSTDHF